MAAHPTATYRLQLGPAFDFDDAAAVIPYLARLGISHVYASPYLQAAPGSTHGYDVVDYQRVNEELGGEKGRGWFCRTLQEAGMGHILDVVPNHMAISGPENVWWWDVLENGMSSRFATFFDVDWEYTQGSSGNRILLPILGDHCGRVIESGEIRIDRAQGSFLLRYYDHVAPVSPRTLVDLLTAAARESQSDELGFLAGALERLPASSATDRQSVHRRHRDKEVLRRHLATLLDSRPNVRRAVDVEVERINADADLMDALHEAQNYRLAFWRLAGSNLGYRRFFDINTLVGLRMEDPEVFRETHRLILEWLQDGSLNGVRVDHPDGLRDPRQYFERLREAAPGAWIVAEKILEPGEQLPRTWPVNGTTGYDFLNVVNRLLVDPRAESELSAFYSSFTGEKRSYATILHRSKHLVMEELFASDVYRLIDLFSQICSRHRRYRDFANDILATVLTELLAAFPVYRSYAVAETEQLHEHDRAVIEEAVNAARDRLPEVDEEIFEFAQSILTLEVGGALESEFVMRFQQLAGPVTAKGAEDTAFYIYNRFTALNEVGGDPALFGGTVAAFHEYCSRRAQQWPTAMSAASTHDTKRSEDTRARLSVLSAIPECWRHFVTKMAEHNDRYRTGGAPDRNLEYLLYQCMVGAWPISGERMQTFAEKAMREAKQHTSWTNQNAEYEEAVHRFLEGAMGDDHVAALVGGIVDEIRIPGWKRSIAATVIRFTAPGVPDTYQGCELWDHSLVDPDNRRAVDYEARAGLLDRLELMLPGEAFAEWDTGLPKLHTVRVCALLRAERPESFGPESGYAPITIENDPEDALVAYQRGDDVVVIADRFAGRPETGKHEIPSVTLPPGSWEDRLSGNRHRSGTHSVAAILQDRPAAVLVRGSTR